MASPAREDGLTTPDDIAALDRAWRADPDESFSILIALGSEHLKAHNLTEARAAFERADVLRPGDAEVQNLLGMANFKLGDFDRARRIFEDLVDRFPDAIALELNIALVLLKSGSFEAARDRLEQIVQREPEHPRAGSYLGLVYEQLGDLRAAGEAYRRSGNMKAAAKIEQGQGAGAPTTETPTTDEQPADEQPAGDQDADTELAEVARALDAAARPEGAIHIPTSAVAAAGAGEEMVAEPAPMEAVGEEQTATAEAVDAGVDDAPPAELAAPAQVDQQPTAPMDPSTFAPSPAADGDGDTPGMAELSQLPSEDETPAADTAQKTTVDLADVPPLERELAITLLDGLVQLRLDDRALLRSDRWVGRFGELKVEPVFRRQRGKETEEHLGGERPVVNIEGRGTALLRFEEQAVVSASFDEELFVIETRLLALLGSCNHETGRLSMPDKTLLHLLRLRGQAQALLVADRLPARVRIVLGPPLVVRASALVAFTGKVLPRVASSQPGATDEPAMLNLLGEGEAWIDGGTLQLFEINPESV